MHFQNTRPLGQTLGIFPDGGMCIVEPRMAINWNHKRLSAIPLYLAIETKNEIDFANYAIKHVSYKNGKAM